MIQTIFFFFFYERANIILHCTKLITYKQVVINGITQEGIIVDALFYISRKKTINRN